MRISRYYRHYQSKTVRYVVLMSGELEQGGIPILPDILGIALSTSNHGKHGWGFTAREMTPRSAILNSKTKLIPCFSLYRHDIPDLQDQSKKTPLNYAFDYIIVPIIHNFCKTFLQLGILVEAHRRRRYL